MFQKEPSKPIEKKPGSDPVKKPSLSNNALQDLEKQCQIKEVALGRMHQEISDPNFYLKYKDQKLKAFFQEKENLEKELRLIYEKLEKHYEN